METKVVVNDVGGGRGREGYRTEGVGDNREVRHSCRGYDKPHHLIGVQVIVVDSDATSAGKVA